MKYINKTLQDKSKLPCNRHEREFACDLYCRDSTALEIAAEKKKYWGSQVTRRSTNAPRGWKKSHGAEPARSTSTPVCPRERSVSPAPMTGTRGCTPSQEHAQCPHGDSRVLRAITKGCGLHTKLVLHGWVP